MNSYIYHEAFRDGELKAWASYPPARTLLSIPSYIPEEFVPATKNHVLLKKIPPSISPLAG
ncbi:MAG: hypothetical protein JXB48_06625 [Candidatus Latescibacteria bacterium]|nr:hypothetical protein [Candidatus Latescibacterota bacterium]